MCTFPLGIVLGAIGGAIYGARFEEKRKSGRGFDVIGQSRKEEP